MGDAYTGRTLWGVRWCEAGMAAQCHECGNEEQARSMHAYLTRRYSELGRSDSPELIRADIVWRPVQGGNSDAR